MRSEPLSDYFLYNAGSIPVIKESIIGRSDTVPVNAEDAERIRSDINRIGLSAFSAYA